MFTGKTRSKTIGSVTVEPGFKWYPEVSRLYQVLRDSESYTMTNQEIYACSAVIYGFKNAGVYGRISTFYPFCGTTAAAQKYNLLDPQDTNGAFRLSFSGGWTHSATGALPNGSTGYANTFWTPSVNASTSGASMGIYSRTNNTSNNQFFGASGTPASRFFDWFIFGGNGGSRSGAAGITFPSAGPTVGTHIMRRNSTTDFQAYRNGASLGTSATAASSMPSINVYFGALNNAGTAAQFNNWELGCAFLGIGLTNQNALDMNYIMNTYAKIMNRFVPV